MQYFEICKFYFLNGLVNCLLSSNFILEKRVSREPAKTFAKLTQTDLSTNRIKVELALYESESSDVNWNFNKDVEALTIILTSNL